MAFWNRKSSTTVLERDEDDALNMLTSVGKQLTEGIQDYNLRVDALKSAVAEARKKTGGKTEGSAD